MQYSVNDNKMKYNIPPPGGGGDNQPRTNGVHLREFFAWPPALSPHERECTFIISSISSRRVYTMRIKDVFNTCITYKPGQLSGSLGGKKEPRLELER